MNLYYQPAITEGINYLDSEESRHAIKVLRHNSGDIIHVIDGKGCFYNAIIIDANPKKCIFEISEKRQEPQKSYYIHIAIAPTKNIDRIEWFVEKAVEIGIDEISFVICDNSERKVVKSDRIHRKAISAIKQSVKAKLPKINEPERYSTFINRAELGNKFIAYVDFTNPETLFKQAKSGEKYCLLIGPEGDFSVNELESAITAGFKKVSLGISRLRTETAAVVACNTLNLINE